MTMPQQDGTEFRLVAGHPHYAVGDDGSVWSCKNRGNTGGADPSKWRKANPTPRRVDGGYMVVGLAVVRNKNVTKYVHQLVLEAFVGPAPTGMVACHGDGNPTNNRLSNLRWGTRKDNEADKERHGRRRRGATHQNAKATEEKVREARRLREAGWMLQTIADHLQLCRTTVSAIVNGYTWNHVV